jgi:Tfp pilus assembly protein PilO
VKLFRRVIVEKRAALIPIGLAIAANLAAYFLVLYPLQSRVSSAEVRVLAATRAQREAEHQLAGARATQTGKQAAEIQLQKFYHQVLPGNLADARQTAYVRLTQLAAETNVRYERHTAEETAVKNSGLTRLQLLIVLDGSYQDIRRFVHAIETAPEFLIIDNVALAMGNDPNARLILTLGVSTYYWNGRNAT